MAQDKIKLRGKLDELRADNSEHQKSIATQRQEHQKLQRIVTKAYAECARQKKQLEEVVKEMKEVA